MKLKKSRVEHALVHGLESSVDELGVIGQDEIEYEIYGMYKSLTEIESLSEDSELQEQYNILTETGTVRVRSAKLASEDKTTYIMTTKTFGDGIGTPEENFEVPEHIFNHFKVIAQSGLLKRRYFIKAGKQLLNDGTYEKLVWEVDVFLNAQGEPLGTVKIDLQVLEPLSELPTLPFELVNRIDLPLDFNDRTHEQKAAVKKILDAAQIRTGVKNTTSLESGDAIAYKSLEKHYKDGEIVTGMEVEFKSDTYTDKGPADGTLIDFNMKEMTVAFGDEEQTIEFDYQDVTFHKGDVIYLEVA